MIAHNLFLEGKGLQDMNHKKVDYQYNLRKELYKLHIGHLVGKGLLYNSNKNFQGRSMLHRDLCKPHRCFLYDRFLMGILASNHYHRK